MAPSTEISSKAAAAAVATEETSTAESTGSLQGIDIAKVLRSTGPVVSCVLLRADAETNTKNNNDEDSNTLLSQFVEEIQIDTTPKKNEVEKILGGPWTFVGQYEEEGIMLMARRGCVFYDNDDDDEDEEEEEEEEQKQQQPKPLLNHHKLQPPFDTVKVYGDILVMKVAEVEDPLDNDEGKSTTENNPSVEVASNEDFFLNYTKESYLKFAARTDVVAPEPPAINDEIVNDNDEEASDDDDEQEGEWSDGEDDDEEDEDEEEDQGAMMQMLMASVLRKFQEENGRPPSTEEVAVLKLTIAQKLGIELPGMAMNDDDDDNDNNNNDDSATKNGDNSEESKSLSSPAGQSSIEDDKKRSPEETGKSSEPTSKKVKLGIEEEIEEQTKAVPSQ